MLEQSVSPYLRPGGQMTNMALDLGSITKLNLSQLDEDDDIAE